LNYRVTKVGKKRTSGSGGLVQGISREKKGELWGGGVRKGKKTLSAETNEGGGGGAIPSKGQVSSGSLKKKYYEKIKKGGIHSDKRQES